MTLKRIRESHNYSQQEMANFLKISKSYYCQIENNQRTLSYCMAIKIADIFNLKPDEIFYKDLKKRINSIKN